LANGELQTDSFIVVQRHDAAVAAVSTPAVEGEPPRPWTMAQACKRAMNHHRTPKRLQSNALAKRRRVGNVLVAIVAGPKRSNPQQVRPLMLDRLGVRQIVADMGTTMPSREPASMVISLPSTAPNGDRIP